jgi:hypothetical protein
MLKLSDLNTVLIYRSRVGIAECGHDSHPKTLAIRAQSCERLRYSDLYFAISKQLNIHIKISISKYSINEFQSRIPPQRSIDRLTHKKGALTMTEGQGKTNFWATFPGLLTGIAALITAFGTIYLGVRATDMSAPSASESSEISTQYPDISGVWKQDNGMGVGQGIIQQNGRTLISLWMMDVLCLKVAF